MEQKDISNPDTNKQTDEGLLNINHVEQTKIDLLDIKLAKQIEKAFWT